MASSTGYYLGQAGVRLSTILHIGGDAVLGIRIPDAALMFQADPFTEAIVIFGEIGSSQEEELAQLIVDRKVTKPVIAYIGGKAAREGTRFSHAGAIIEGGRGTHELFPTPESCRQRDCRSRRERRPPDNHRLRGYRHGKGHTAA